MATITYAPHVDAYDNELSADALLALNFSDPVYFYGFGGTPTGTLGNVFPSFFGTTGLIDILATGSFTSGGLNGMPSSSSTYSTVQLSYEGMLMATISGLTLSQSVVDQMGFFEAVMSGNDTIRGSVDFDILMGGKGNDTYYLDAPEFSYSWDMVVEKAGEGTDTIRVGKSYKLPDNVENLVLTGTGNFNAIGNASANKLYGNTGNNLLDGRAGNDTMSGGAGNDIYIVDSAADIVTETDTTATAIDSVRSYTTYTLSANVENLSLYGTASINGTGNGLTNSIVGNSGANRLTGAAGNDILTGREGNDTLDGGDGLDIASYSTATSAVTVNLATSVASGGAGSDSLISIEGVRGSNYADSIVGNAGVNSFDAGYGNDTLIGGGGADSLNGGAGNDLLVGGTSNDVLYGGTGLDVFRFDSLLGTSTTPNIDQITDFVVADDTIQLENSIFTKFGTTTGTINAAYFKSNSTGLAADSNDYIIYETDTGKLFYDSNGNAAGGSIQIALLGTNLALTAADFVII
jgi:Ca2+-binding RTX toxin-like protein